MLFGLKPKQQPLTPHTKKNRKIFNHHPKGRAKMSNMSQVLTKRKWKPLTNKILVYTSRLIKKNFMASFYGWGSTASRLQPLWGGSLLFTIQSPEIPGTHWPRKDERLSRHRSHPVVLSTGLLDWESSALTTRPLLHDIASTFLKKTATNSKTFV